MFFKKEFTLLRALRSLALDSLGAQYSGAGRGSHTVLARAEICFLVRVHAVLSRSTVRFRHTAGSLRGTRWRGRRVPVRERDGVERARKVLALHRRSSRS